MGIISLLWNILLFVLGAFGIWIILLGIFAITGDFGFWSWSILILFIISVILRFTD
jgi:hypothetical protein